ncbi:hypothetical protein [uncultured Phocaeicola sp.]|uniref:hypothetical protein n=1 Tax=uncultured Phocaeicola sp. TaxID=990718 RepID=UPI0025ABBA6A|nr:hypothetical protein [uncultured Phocaeicola sp.]
MCSRILRRKHRRILRRILLFLIVIYYNNIYSPKDSHKGLSCEDIVQKQPNIPSENPAGTPHGDEAPKASSSAKEFFHKLNATPEEKQAVLVPIIDRIVAGYRYTRPRALDALVVLVNEFLIPHFDAQSNFAKTPHNGRIIWLQDPPRGEPDTASHTKTGRNTAEGTGRTTQKTP